MRVLLFSSTFAPRTGGVETVTRRLARELTDRGHELLVATNRYPRSLPERERIDGIEVRRRLFPTVVPGLEPRSALQTLKMLLLLPLAPLAFLWLYALARRFRPDVVNIHYLSNPAFYMLLVARLQRIPVVLSFHGSDLSDVPYPAIYRAPLRWACRRAAAFTCCSEDMRMYLHRVLPRERWDRSTVAHNGISGEPSTAAPPAAPRPFVLLTARLSDKKGVDVALRSAAVLRRRGIEMQLVILGQGPLRDSLQALAASLDIRENVTFLPPVSHASARALAQEAYFVVVPSYWEAFGMVCLEAMVAGKAVVASRSGGIPEIVLDGETGILVDPGNPEQLADAMAALLADPERAASMGRRGRERALTRFSWDRTVNAYLHAYDQALNVQNRRMPAAELGSR